MRFHDRDSKFTAAFDEVLGIDATSNTSCAPTFAVAIALTSLGWIVIPVAVVVALAT
jgi:hypothetical protein